MGPKMKPTATKFNSMPNFRIVGGEGDGNEREKKAPCLYRSSRPDFLNVTELEKFKKLGIRCIVDFRSRREYNKANGDKLIDNLYPLYKVSVPFWKKYKPTETVKYSQINAKSLENNESDFERRDIHPTKKHFLIDFFKANYIWAVYNRAPLWFRIYSLVFAIFDLIMQTEFRYFVRSFAKKVLNKEGLSGQYKDMINYSQGAFCAALKLLTNPENVPAMVNCAHGKDRTGIVSALVLACLGRSKHEIAEDYAKSESELEPMKDRVYKEIVDKFHMCTSFVTAKYEVMMEILDYIDDNWGSVPNYLESIGFSKQEQEKLKENLLSYDR